VLRKLAKGIWITVLVATVAYAAACTIGLGLALMQMSRSIVLRQLSRLYIELMRGGADHRAPPLRGLRAGARAGGPLELRSRAPGPRAGAAAGLQPPLARGDRADAGLLGVPREIFRAGLQSVDKGQVEAAMALGLKGWQRFRLVTFPQAFRTIFPALGNDFVAMVKDSSLVSVLGVTDVTQLGKVTAAGNFRYFETYNVVALIYLTLTIGLSLALGGSSGGCGAGRARAADGEN
jgi:ABC-type amino acid transport system permease subunit